MSLAGALEARSGTDWLWRFALGLRHRSLTVSKTDVTYVTWVQLEELLNQRPLQLRNKCSRILDLPEVKAAGVLDLATFEFKAPKYKPLEVEHILHVVSQETLQR